MSNKVKVVSVVASVNSDNLIIKEVLFPANYGFRWLKAKGYAQTAFIVVDHSFSKKENPEAQALLVQLLNNGIDLEGIHYVPAFAGSSHLRKGESVWMDASIKDEFLDWLHCGVNTRHNMVTNKTLVYDGMSAMSSTTPWENVFTSDVCHGKMKPIDIDRVAILPDAEVAFKGIFDVVENGNVTRSKEDYEVKNKFTDGANLYIVDDDDMSSFERRKLLSELEAFTFRAPGFKGLAIPVLKSALRRFVINNKCGYMIKDKWGHSHNIFDLQLISFVSTFKWSKCVEDFSDYQKAFKELGHAFSVCVTAHKRRADIPYQQFQTLQMNKTDAFALSDRSVEFINNFKKLGESAKLVGGNLGKAIALHPAMLNDDFVAEEIQKAYTSRRYRIAGGRIPQVAKNPFAAPDVVAILQHVFGLPVEGVIPGKAAVCNLFKEGIVDVTRCPHLDNAHCLRKIIRMSGYDGLFIGSTIFFSVHDATMNTLQMDYDGDHVNVTADEFIIRKALESIKRLGNVPLYYKAKGSAAGDVTDAAIVEFLTNLEPAPVGLYANTLTKIWAFGVHTDAEKREVALETEGANTCIDAAKNVSGDSKTAASSAGQQIIADKSAWAKPMFMAYAKSSPFIDGSFASIAKSCKFYNSSCVDNYSSHFMANTEDVLEVEKPDEAFDWHILTVGEVHRLAGLCTASRSEFDENGVRHFVNDGFFNKLIETETNVVGNEVAVAEYFDEQMNAMKQAVYAFGMDNGFDAGATLNALVMAIYTMKRGNVNMLKRVLWQMFGEELLDNIQSNLDEKVEVDFNEEDFAIDDVDF